MKLYELDAFFKKNLPIEGMRALDNSLNGLQVGDFEQDVKKIAYAVDASLTSFELAKEKGADLLFCHHGIFWGRQEAVVGTLYDRISFLTNNRLALYAVHLPLDMDLTLGNNAGIARAIGLKDIRPFDMLDSRYHVGVQGELAEEISLQELVAIFPGQGERYMLWPFGKKTVKKVAIISGGGGASLLEAAREGTDLFITGEILHQHYHMALEEKINVLAAGHYFTETFGVRAVMEHTEKELGIPGVFLEIPTGL
ncbi:Nif3-like dinuclear metal center hexameric protein [Spirochaetia bacterium 38H-sp]|uniref:Nif3-like dinuclear metal center hexameric protein n=1 Tax=Rarispira pelagica TaxID=3141764 RepID=A0ABU9U8H9_9SPIR